MMFSLRLHEVGGGGGGAPASDRARSVFEDARLVLEGGAEV